MKIEILYIKYYYFINIKKIIRNNFIIENKKLKLEEYNMKYKI